MEKLKNQVITLQATVAAPVDRVWRYWTEPNHIIIWNNPSDDWHTTRVENDLRPGGKFLSRMEAKDGSAQFDFTGTYDEVRLFEKIEYTISDGRKVSVIFEPRSGETGIIESFETEDEHTIEKQWEGWHAILNNFKWYAETNK